ncbi:MAG: serine hydroxymethyltransferase [Firmicutes bacterium]|uniref:Serine hydroxymethyltransferase n=1 Tax=Candidatus Onthovivens merdipullorum TaxID=2840889 RepID=A0A9D9DJU0_9BACL|nr:serine hydroxymethyltransferase [Candidatus Onthovivens merdipullorum]
MYEELKNSDYEVYLALNKEFTRESENIELIASENFASKNVLMVQGSILTNKYAEGYPSKRYYGGCEYIDQIENLAIERCKKLFGAKFANVQPHSGSSANMAAIRSLINLGDTILGMSLDAGGHLSHGYKLSFSGKDYKSYSYGVDVNSGFIDYEEVYKIAKEVKPKLIICGASAYPRKISFKKFSEIAKSVGAYLMADIAHIAGLCATGYHENPLPYCDIVTSTTHKTLRGPRGGLIMTNDEEIAKKVNKNVFPGIQGGPLMHVIGAKAVMFKEDLEDSYKEYIHQVILNTKAMCDEFIKLGYKLVSGGSDNHLLLIDVKSSVNMSGKEVEKLLEKVNITLNKNTIPGDTLPPLESSGVRIGSPAMTSRGFKEKEFIEVTRLIDKAIKNKDDEIKLKNIKEEVISLVKAFPMFNR